MVRVDEDTSRRASCLDQSEATRRHAVLEQPLSFAEHQLVQAIVQEGHGPASVGKPVPPILLGATGRLHDAVESDLRDCDDFSHGFSPVSWLRTPRTNDRRVLT